MFPFCEIKYDHIAEHLAMVSVGSSLPIASLKDSFHLFFPSSIFMSENIAVITERQHILRQPGTWDLGLTTTHTPGHKSPQTNYRETIAD